MNGALIDQSRYQIGKTLDCRDVDMLKRLRPAAFMEIAQEAAYLAAQEMGFGYSDLIATHKAWVLARMTIQFEDLPLWRERLTLTTWHKGLAGPFHLRDFRMCDSEGRVRVKATSSWVILDTAARSLVRNSELDGLVPENRICREHVIETPAERVMMPRGAEPILAAKHTVVFSDTDFIGHTNNVRYAIWAMDCLPYEELMQRPVHSLSINFNHETKAGECVELWLFREADSCYVEGKVEDRQAFCAKITF